MSRSIATTRWAPATSNARVNPPGPGPISTTVTSARSPAAPAIARLRGRGVEAFGPVPPDALFTAQARNTYDAALCMYHDQALIPAKTLAFSETVNVTLGLPIVRTSVDHGTALPLAGTGRARPDSLFAAVELALDLV